MIAGKLTSVFGRSLSLLAVGIALTGCPSGKGGPGEAQWPKAGQVKTAALPSGASWVGVFFINSSGSRGTMHILSSGDEKIHGCWIAEDKHATASFVGTTKDNLAMFDWTEKRVGFAGPPSRLTAYLVMSSDAEGRVRVAGEYGEDLTNDGGNKWEGVRQKNQEPKEDGCKLEAGDTVPTEGGNLN